MTGVIAFASAKAALRSVAQGLARELGPYGIHIAHIVIDGVIRGEIRGREVPRLCSLQRQDWLASRRCDSRCLLGAGIVSSLAPGFMNWTCGHSKNRLDIGAPERLSSVVP